MHIAHSFGQLNCCQRQPLRPRQVVSSHTSIGYKGIVYSATLHSRSFRGSVSEGTFNLEQPRNCHKARDCQLRKFKNVSRVRSFDSGLDYIYSLDSRYFALLAELVSVVHCWTLSETDDADAPPHSLFSHPSIMSRQFSVSPELWTQQSIVLECFVSWPRAPY